MRYHTPRVPVTDQDRLRLREDKTRARELIERWAASGRSLRSVLRAGRMSPEKFWELLKSPDLAGSYQSLRGLWSFNAMDGLLDLAEQRLEETGHAAWGAIAQKQVHAMVAVIEPSLRVIDESDTPLPETIQRIEEILDLGRERLARLQELEAAARAESEDAPTPGVIDITPDNE